MSAGCTALAVRPRLAPQLDVLGAIAAVAWTLEPLAPHERAGLLKDEAAFLVDGLLVRVARGKGALDVAIGEGLDALSVGERAMQLGYSGIGDYARERLGIGGGTALRMARLARALRERPLLRAAVRRGEVSARKAETVVRVARGDDEAAWVERARASTVRALAAAVRAEEGIEEEPEEPWDRGVVALTPEQRAKVDEGLALAGAILGQTAPPWQRIEAMCQEYLGAHPREQSEEEARDEQAPAALARDVEAMKEACEIETARWEALSEPERFEAPPGPGAEDGDAVDAYALDARLRELAAMRDRWDALVGHLGMLLQNTGLWRHMFFVSLGHYAAERLGMSGRALEQRAALERRLWALPALREAMRSGRISYEKARVVAAHADERTVGALIARAEAVPCIALRRELEKEEEAQMCSQGELALRLPRRVSLLLAAATCAAREAEGRWLSGGEALAVIAEHCAATWKAEVSRQRSTPARRAIARGGGWCQVPGCSRPADDAHHIRFRSRGGGDQDWNMLGGCKPHHLHGVHAGWIRVSGRAPNGLRWEIGASRPIGRRTP